MLFTRPSQSASPIDVSSRSPENVPRKGPHVHVPLIELPSAEMVPVVLLVSQKPPEAEMEKSPVTGSIVPVAGSPWRSKGMGAVT